MKEFDSNKWNIGMGWERKEFNLLQGVSLLTAEGYIYI